MHRRLHDRSPGLVILVLVPLLTESWRDEIQSHRIPERNIRGGPRMCESVGPVLTPWNLGNNKFASCHGLLQPELFDVQVANLANSLSHDDTACGGRICLEFETGAVPKVVCEPLDVESLDGSLQRGIEFRIT